MGAGIDLALDLVEERKADYKADNLEYFRPWFFLLTDGEPTDGHAFDAAVERLNTAERRKQITVFAVGVGGDVNWKTLARVSKDRDPVKLQGLDFAKMFEWLSNSLSAVSNSSTHGANDTEVAGNTEQIALPSPRGWAEV
jgi:uncharacterized protein YegL